MTRLNNAEYLNLMSRLVTLIETSTAETLGLTAEEFAELKGQPEWWDALYPPKSL